MQAFFNKLYHKILIQQSYSEPHYKLLGFLNFLGYPFYYILWKYLFPQPYENLPLRLAGSLLYLLLFFHDKWPQRLKPYLILYWYLILIYGLSFYANFMMLKNGLNLVWVLSTMAAVFILILVVDWISFFVIYLTGAGLAWCIYLLQGGTSQYAISYMSYLSVYLFLGIIGSLFMYNTARSQKERLAAMASLSSNVAHELRTPLLGLKGGIMGLKKYLPVLCETYTNAKSAGIPVSPIRKNQLDNLLPTLERMNAEIRFSNMIIDMLLMNAGGNNINSENFEIHSMAKCIQDALNRYPFDSVELKAKLHWSPSNDFDFEGVPLLLEHIIFNLLKNALYFITNAAKGEIFIWLEPQGKFNEVHFKDTGQGVAEAALPRLFEHFFTTTLTGTGIGLSFCKAVMKGFGGSIVCQSIEGEFAEFILKFPKVE